MKLTAIAGVSMTMLYPGPNGQQQQQQQQQQQVVMVPQWSQPMQPAMYPGTDSGLSCMLRI
jgi:hypothetical protein